MADILRLSISGKEAVIKKCNISPQRVDKNILVCYNNHVTSSPPNLKDTVERQHKGVDSSELVTPFKAVTI